ncbi:uncharacterized protein MONBRDRAFT_12543 [Monosiga brevicollis MX1]|uniref:RNA helicase n=1 Tax=Monosiga brevicollis TaxID=81824 RepID=A9VCL0_MONBE|nr:uncharacterized protein MONBRDRAFT_12543 [Monosiga brevicollis MX1]EDQ84701.1 predicted protein [Monosiga brevicollis MX1]|eukprot:XP_001750487.1 hypothetical protein [Monosiga brevicollis MX1]
MAVDPVTTLWCLKQSTFKREGLPDKNSPQARDICSLIKPQLSDATGMSDLRRRLREFYELSYTIAFRPLQLALRQYRQLLPPLPAPLRKRRSEGHQLHRFKALTEAQQDANELRQKLKHHATHGGLLKPKGGVRLIAKHSLVAEPGQKSVLEVQVHNERPKERLLHVWDIISKPRHVSLWDEKMGIDKVPVPANGTVNLRISYHPPQQEHVVCLLVLSFGGFHLGHVLELKAESALLKQLRAENEPRVRRRQLKIRGPVHTNGIRPSGDLPKYTTPLPKFENATPVSELAKKLPEQPEPLTPSTYAKRLALLWHLEEHQMNLDLDRYSMENAPLTISGRFLALVVPGLAERRPSVLKGDAIIIQNASGESHRGYVHHVRQCEVLIKFHETVHAQHIDRMPYNVRFTLKRTGLQRRHRALRDISSSPLLPLVIPTHPLFPKKASASQPRQLQWRSPNLNNEQQQAVQAVIQLPPQSPPYIIFGPPGTGKTMTLVEAVYQASVQTCNVNICNKHEPFAHAHCASLPQVFASKQGSRVLVCAPSNDATDVLLARITRAVSGLLPQSAILRANAAFRQRSGADREEVAKYSCYDEEANVYKLPDNMSHVRLVFSTLAFAATVTDVQNGFKGVDYVFIDEAGHADECETLLPLIGGVGAWSESVGTRIVLAGDPCQLGPIIRSSVAVKHGLGESMLERLMSQAPYARQLDAPTGTAPTFNRAYVTKLIKNYRSHPKLLAVPSRLFYDDELEACADVDERNSLLTWDQLPNAKVPLVFHGVQGKHEQEGDSPSFFNLEELVQVCQYVEDLLDHRPAGLRPSDIGVIAPYTKQCQRLRRLFERKGWDRIKVGTVEAFQGDERRVIIVSTVRSVQPTQLDTVDLAAFLRFDVEHSLGFLRNPKRFNVTVTRPKALLVVVGNPFVLRCDPCWKQLIDFAREQGCYAGTEYVGQAAQTEQFAEAMRSVGLDREVDGSDDDDDDDMDEAAAADLPWQREH